MGTFLEECRMDLGFKGCEKSLRRILEKQLGFEFKKVDNKLKIEQRKMKKTKTKPAERAPSKANAKRFVNNNKQRESVSVSIQTQTVNQQMQAVPIIGMEEMGQVHRYRYQY